ncbi:ROK family protein [Microbacteriaceae bacterium 4G12]
MRAGLDIGGTKTHAVAVDDSGSPVHSLRMSTGFGADAVIGTAVAAVRGLADLAGIEPAHFASIGVGIPGTVEPSTGTVSHAVNLGVDRLPLGAALADRFAAPVRVENDVNAAALGAYALLGAEAGASMAYLNLGTGLAAGLVLDGRLWRGAGGSAGEIGHIPVDPHGEVCPCGQRGCLETVASGSTIARQWPTTDPQPARALFAAAAAGNPVAVGVRIRLLENIAAAVRILVLTVDPETVVIGGGLSSLGDDLLRDLRAVLTRWEEGSPFLASTELPARVRVLPPGFPAAAVGAALVGSAEVSLSANGTTYGP